MNDNNVISVLANEQNIPKFYKVHQHFDPTHIKIEDITSLVFSELNRCKINEKIVKGMTVAITCGSRGIANIKEITKAVGDYFIHLGARPFVTATMGSHGGARADGQLEILTSYGIHEQYLGFPVKSSMETKQIGYTKTSLPVHMDRNALEADAIFVVGRIKAHTAFEGPYESGIMKMITIGLGKQKGAETVHEFGFGTAAQMIPEFARVALEKTNIIGALGIIENAFDQILDLVAMKKEEIVTIEPQLLKRAKSAMGRIYISHADVLIVDQIGKNFSGDGMDPNIAGNFATPYKKGGLQKQVIAVLSLSPETHGNFNGIGLADITTRRAFNQMNFENTYPNAITSTVLNVVKIPMVLANDKIAIQIAIRSCNNIDKKNPKIIRIKNTRDIEEIEVSEGLIDEVRLIKELDIIEGPKSLKFDKDGNLF